MSKKATKTELCLAFTASKFSSSRVVCRLVDRTGRFPSCADSKCPRLSAVLDSLCAQIPVTSFMTVTIKQIGRLLSRNNLSITFGWSTSSSYNLGHHMVSCRLHFGRSVIPSVIRDPTYVVDFFSCCSVRGPLTSVLLEIGTRYRSREDRCVRVESV